MILLGYILGIGQYRISHNHRAYIHWLSYPIPILLRHLDTSRAVVSRSYFNSHSMGRLVLYIFVENQYSALVCTGIGIDNYQAAQYAILLGAADTN